MMLAKRRSSTDEIKDKKGGGTGGGRARASSCQCASALTSIARSSSSCSVVRVWQIKTVKARVWPWLSGESFSTCRRCFMLVWQRRVSQPPLPTQATDACETVQSKSGNYFDRGDGGPLSQKYALVPRRARVQGSWT